MIVSGGGVNIDIFAFVFQSTKHPVSLPGSSSDMAKGGAWENTRWETGSGHAGGWKKE
jgi:hypothetical protein